MKIKLLVDVLPDAPGHGLTAGRIFEVLELNESDLISGVRWYVETDLGVGYGIFAHEAIELEEPAPLPPTAPPNPPGAQVAPAEDTARRLLVELIARYRAPWYYQTGKNGYECSFCGTMIRYATGLTNALNHAPDCPYPAAMQFVREHEVNE